MFSFTNSSEVKLSNNSEPCPDCGRQSRLMDGVFNFDTQGLATALSAPSWSIEALSAVQGTLEELTEELSGDDLNTARYDAIMAKLHEQDPAVFRVVAEGVANRSPERSLSFVTKMLAVVGGVVTLRDGGQLTYDTARAIILQIFF